MENRIPDYFPEEGLPEGEPPKPAPKPTSEDFGEPEHCGECGQRPALSACVDLTPDPVYRYHCVVCHASGPQSYILKEARIRWNFVALGLQICKETDPSKYKKPGNPFPESGDEPDLPPLN